MKYVFKDRTDLEDVQGLRDKLEACVDMIRIYCENFNFAAEDVMPDSVVISTSVNARDLHCAFDKDGKLFYAIDLRQMYGFGGVFYCISDLHQAAELVMHYVRAKTKKASKGTQTITLGGA